MPTFKIQGQLYHAVGSLLPSKNKEPKCLHIYFMGNGESDRQLSVCPHANGEILYDLQEILHSVNPYVQGFKSVIKTLPSNSTDFKLQRDY